MKIPNHVFRNDRFDEAHELFLTHMERSSDLKFLDFNHQYFHDEEIGYKHQILSNGRRALTTRNWNSWIAGSGKILAACKKACHPSVSNNLLEHRWDGSYKALYRVKGLDQVTGLEKALLDYIGEYPPLKEGFGDRLDTFADYLRIHHLGCNWAFVTYLAFLADPICYFPIRPVRFDDLLGFYGSETKLSSRVEWSRYQVLLELSDWLADKLTIYGYPDRIQTQSYMWVVANLITQSGGSEPFSRKYVAFDAELRRRIERAKRRERIGLLGERIVLEAEKERLTEKGYQVLAERVKLISAEDSGCGYDVLSFDTSGYELHIEVKTTEKSRDSDIGFYISANEVAVAREDRTWRLFRVRDVQGFPETEDMGNPIRDTDSKYILNPSTYFLGFD